MVEYVYGPDGEVVKIILVIGHDNNTVRVPADENVLVIGERD